MRYAESRPTRSRVSGSVLRMHRDDADFGRRRLRRLRAFFPQAVATRRGDAEQHGADQGR